MTKPRSSRLILKNITTPLPKQLNEPLVVDRGRGHSIDERLCYDLTISSYHNGLLFHFNVAYLVMCFPPHFYLSQCIAPSMYSGYCDSQCDSFLLPLQLYLYFHRSLQLYRLILGQQCIGQQYKYLDTFACIPQLVLVIQRFFQSQNKAYS